MSNLEILEAEVMQLAPVERSHLLERLIVSRDSDTEVEAARERGLRFEQMERIPGADQDD